jgi:hypothetical protein
VKRHLSPHWKRKALGLDGQKKKDMYSWVVRAAPKLIPAAIVQSDSHGIATFGGLKKPRHGISHQLGRNHGLTCWADLSEQTCRFFFSFGRTVDG